MPGVALYSAIRSVFMPDRHHGGTSCLGFAQRKLLGENHKSKKA